MRPLTVREAQALRALGAGSTLDQFARALYPDSPYWADTRTARPLPANEGVYRPALGMLGRLRKMGLVRRVGDKLWRPTKLAAALAGDTSCET